MRINSLDFKYVLLQSYNVCDTDEMRKYEQKWADKLKPNLNTRRCLNTPEDDIESDRKYRNTHRKEIKKYYDEHKQERKKYRDDHKQEISIYKKIRYEKNKHVIICHCGGTYNIGKKSNRSQHFKTNIHKDFKTLVKHHIF